MNFSLGLLPKDTLCSSTRFEKKPVYSNKTQPLESTKSFPNICQTQAVSWSQTINPENGLQRLTLKAPLGGRQRAALGYKGLRIPTETERWTWSSSVCWLARRSASQESNLLSFTQQRWNIPHFVFHRWNRQRRVLEVRFPAKACWRSPSFQTVHVLFWTYSSTDNPVDSNSQSAKGPNRIKQIYVISHWKVLVPLF